MIKCAFTIGVYIYFVWKGQNNIEIFHLSRLISEKIYEKQMILRVGISNAMILQRNS